MKHISSFFTQTGFNHQSNDWLLKLWQRSAPTALRQPCRPVTYHDNCLKLQVESSIWLSRIRQQKNSLIRQLRQNQEFSGLNKITLEVSPQQMPAKQKTAHRQHRKISSSNKAILLDSASHLSDPELRRSLERLVKTASES